MALQVGGETQAYCTSCRLMRDHIIVAMKDALPAKVECDVCHKQHLFRSGPPGEKSVASVAAKKAARAKAAVPAAPVIDLAERVAGREAVQYGVDRRFAAGDVVRHPSFGVGLVTVLPAPQKMEVLFEGGTKLLMHDRVVSTAAPLTRPTRREDEIPRGASDAPPRR